MSYSNIAALTHLARKSGWDITRTLDNVSAEKKLQKSERKGPLCWSIGVINPKSVKLV